jgi:serine/threonine protein kinase
MTAPLILNRYRLLETRGKGGFGTVDVAWDSRLQRRVAIKRIPLAAGETDLPGIQEARTAALLNDARIVNALDFEVTGTEALIIMEYVDGPTLGTLLRESAELLDLDTIATIAVDVAAALEYAHENQVLHLDIKPDNILIDHKGQIKVSDFGLSELSGTVGFAEPQGGTIGYMPPEQLTQGDVDARTDLWALAILLYQLLTGSNPFLAQTTDVSLERILNDPLPLPSALRPELDGAIDEVLIRALLADKHERFASIAAFTAELTPQLGNPQTGRRKLKYRVNERDLDEIAYTDAWHEEDLPLPAYEEEDAEDGGGSLLDSGLLWERLPRLLRGILGRLIAALGCGSFAFVGLSGFDMFAQSPAFLRHDALLQLQALSPADLSFVVGVGVALLIAIGGFLVPQLGSALACVALAVGVIVRGALVVGIALAILLGVWWLFFGRRGRVEATLVMLTPALGALWLGFAAPLLAGLLLSWRRALPAAAVQGLVLIALVVLTQGAGIAHTGLVLPAQDGSVLSRLLTLLGLPVTWMTLAAFLLAAFLMAILTARGTVGSAILGTSAATTLLALSCVLGPLFIGSGGGVTDFAVSGVGLALSFILILILSLLGVSANVIQEEV